MVELDKTLVRQLFKRHLKEKNINTTTLVVLKLKKDQHSSQIPEGPPRVLRCGLGL